MKGGENFSRTNSRKEKRAALGVNPFVASLKIRVRAVRSGYVPDDDIMVDQYVDMEMDTYVKLFDKAQLRLIMGGLSTRCLQLWIWMLYEVETGDDYVVVNVKRFMNECSVKCLKTYRAAIAELCRYGYISHVGGHKNTFWLNPECAFKGSRIKAFPQCVVKKQTTE